MYALDSGKNEIDRGADPGAKTKSGKTSLDLALELKDKGKIDLLGAAGSPMTQR